MIDDGEQKYEKSFVSMPKVNQIEAAENFKKIVSM
jgi:hypothetical protein